MRSFFLKGLLGKAAHAGVFHIQFIDLREFATDKHHKVDDYPFGEERGMLMKVDVISRAIRSIDQYEHYRLLYTCPKGKPYTQADALALSNEKGFIILCGYYEGIDERLFELFAIESFSVGDTVLSSGESPALIMAESVIRLLPGVVGKQACVKEDSIVSGLLEYPHYTLPREFEGKQVPEIVLSGHHRQMALWRRKESIRRTLLDRPELLIENEFDATDRTELTRILKEETDATPHT